MNTCCLTNFQKPFCSFLQRNVCRTLEFHPTVIPCRNTFILKRKYPCKLNKTGKEQFRRLKGKDYVYELVEDRNIKKQPEVSVILKDYVDGIGNKGECVTLKRNFAYNQLLMTGLADYATPEAIEEAKRIKDLNAEKDFSSRYAPLVAKFLEKMILTIKMNKDVEWTLEPWHVRVAFRYSRIHVPEECIQLPVKPIKGPNLDLEAKTFLITVTINNKEKATVRCMLLHWTANVSERIFYEQVPWALPLKCMFPEDEEIIAKLPKIKFKTINYETSP